MSKVFIRLVLCVLLSFFLTACAVQKQLVAPFQAHDLDSKLESGQYAQKVDNMMLIFDASGSMNESHKGNSKLDIARNTVYGMIQTLPDLDMDAGLRKFGKSSAFAETETELVYGVKGYSTQGFEGALKSIDRANGESPLALGIVEATRDLEVTKGPIAAIIVSDGQEMDKAPLEAAKKMKAQYGNRICIYTVVIGNDPDGKKLLGQIASASQCGFSVNAADIYSADGMAWFVEKVFLAERVDSDGDGVYDDMDKCPNTPKGTKVNSVGCQMDADGDGVLDDVDECPYTPKGMSVDSKGCPLDMDGDGVYDFKDECPNTPKGVSVDSKGCPLDTDGDGVYDYLDKCPGTPKGSRVNEVGCTSDEDGDGVYDHLDRCPYTTRGVAVDKMGCPLDNDGDGVYNSEDDCPGTPKGARVNVVGCWVIKGARFDTAKWDIKSEFMPQLDEVVSILERNPGLKIVIEGHTDNRGAAGYNQKLSEKRANAVLKYLVGEGIERNRLSAKGYGLSKPIANNATAAGRAVNRRVELTPGH